MNIPTGIVFATAQQMFTRFAIGAWLCRVSLRRLMSCIISVLHLLNIGSQCDCVSKMRFNSLKSSRDSLRQYSFKMISMYCSFKVLPMLALFRTLNNGQRDPLVV